MARKSQLNAPVAPGGEYEGPSKPAPVELNLQERTALKELLNSVVFRKAWHNAKLGEPGCFPDPIPAGTQDVHGVIAGQMAIKQLGRQQGWKLFAAALFRQTEDPKPAKPARRPDFSTPDSFITSEKPEKQP